MFASLRELPNDAVCNELQSPVGKLTIIASSKALCSLLWDTESNAKEYEEIINNLKKSKSNHILNKTIRQLNEYFSGNRKEFDIPFFLNGTNFQKKAWKQLSKIPYGETISYGEQAKRMGDIKKARAVGGANGRNPISIIIPCHRVIGKSGDLTGFGGGLDNKKYLLDLEQGLIH